MSLKEEGIKINYYPIDTAVAMETLAAITEGMVLANMVEIEQGAPDFESLVREGVAYEPPQKDCARDQRVGTLSAVLHKKMATCIEAAAIAVAAARLDGHRAETEFVHETDAYGTPVPWRYHVYAIIDGRRTDPAAELRGYPQAGGACCSSCAEGKPCESECDGHDHAPQAAGACCGSCAQGKPCESECDGHDHAPQAGVRSRSAPPRHILMTRRRER
jgi:hypothetical protein